ncbi:MAG: hypothetical protein WA151_08670, partial [Desulfatirhabdiaceae bacterium]
PCYDNAILSGRRLTSPLRPGYLPSGPATGCRVSHAFPTTGNPVLTELNPQIMIKYHLDVIQT